MGPLAGFLVLMFISAPIVLIIIILSKVNSLTQRIQWLEKEVERLRSQTIPPAPQKEKPATAPPPIIVEQHPAVTIKPERTHDVLAPAPSPISAPVIKEEKRSQAREEWESFVGGKLLNRIGAVALIIGVGFFLKYAFDNNWINETTRVLLGGIAGIALLLAGARFHQKAFQVFAQGLIGAGIAILYLSVFASFNFYHLVSQLSAFILMSLVTLATFHQAFRYNSLAISLLGWAGGYLTPFMLSTGVANEAGLFSYIDLLEAGLLAVVIIRQSWMILEFLTLVGTYLTFILWHSKYYSEGSLLITVLFLTLFWLLFYLADLYRNISNSELHPLRQIVTILNAGIFYSYLYSLVNEYHHETMGILTAALACAYIIPVLITAKKNPSSVLLRDYILTAVILFIIATAVQYQDFTTVSLWSCEAILLMWCAKKWNYRFLANATLLFFIVITGKLFLTYGAFQYEPTVTFYLILNKRFLAFALLSTSMGICAVQLRDIEIRNNVVFKNILNAGWCVLIFMLVTCETVDIFSKYLSQNGYEQVITIEFLRNMTLLIVWISYSALLVYAGLQRVLFPVLVSGLILTGITFILSVTGGFSFEPIQNFRFLFNVRMGAILFVLSCSFISALRLKNAEGLFTTVRYAYPVILIGQVLLLLVLFSGETRDIFERQLYMLKHQAGTVPLPEEINSVENMKQLSLSSLWLVYGIILMIAGIWKRARGIRIMAIIILGIAILKIFIYDLSFLQTLYRIFSFIGLGVILMAASYMYQRYKSLIFDENPTNSVDSGINP